MNSYDYGSVINIIKDAGNIIKKSWDRENTIFGKSSYDYVTDKDLEIQDYLMQRLKKIYKDKDLNFISEEIEINDYNDYNYKNVWIIDPIDGIMNYIHKYPNLQLKFIIVYSIIKSILGDNTHIILT